ncbi:hypothetical protein L1987_15737 [Smallanthus sonchifolius]|uniref:Uncharacterized protein n=1 Tax=Smallanthus sonchifolius TaxID=185202 RepID=A0ACB9J6S4_9ASTR|nr:hypothetical protein L1987_15737 [Smallanthus sonchifolius]
MLYIYIEANSGDVKRVGRSDSFATKFDLEAEEYFPLPKGEVHKKKDFVQDILSLMGQMMMPRKTEITDKLRQEINKILAIRAQMEKISIDEESLAYLGEIAQQASLRHAVQFLSPGNVVEKMNGRDGGSGGSEQSLSECKGISETSTIVTR